MKYDLIIDPPVMNAAGCLGFVPERRIAINWNRLGAFVTNPISLEPRSPAHGTRWLPFAGGFLLHTGYPNPGLRVALRRYGPRWARAPLPIIVHVLCQNAEQVYAMARRLESVAGVAGLELGLPPLVAPQEAIDMVQAASGELPVIARLPFERTVEIANHLAGAFTPPSFDELAQGTGADRRLAGLSMGAPRGVLPGGENAWVGGRLYGPSIYPQTLEVLRAALQSGLPVIAGGGVYSQQQVQTLLAAGATAVQLDAVLWRGGW